MDSTSRPGKNTGDTVNARRPQVRVRNAAVALLLVATAGGIAACGNRNAYPDVDDVLWRQIVVGHLDGLGRSITDIAGEDRASVVSWLEGRGTGPLQNNYWNGASDPLRLRLADGGLVTFALRSTPTRITVNVLVSSGPRDALADPSMSSGPYDGPDSIYTCFSMVFLVEGDSAAYSHDGHAACEPALEKTLAAGARYYEPDTFDG